MALTTNEEALVRQLLGQQSAILSLASSEPTILSKLGAAKVTLSDLVAASAVADADLLLIRQGVTDKSVVASKILDYIDNALDINPTADAAGTVDAITAAFVPPLANSLAEIQNGTIVCVTASGANTGAATFAPDGLVAKSIYKHANAPLVAGDISGVDYVIQLRWDQLLDKWGMLNPATGAAATTTSAGVVELATVAEVASGTDASRVPSVDSFRNANIVQGTEVASTSGTAIDFTGVPAWVKRITILGSSVSTVSTSPIEIQFGDSGGFETTGYIGAVNREVNFTSYSGLTGARVEWSVSSAAAVRVIRAVIEKIGSGNTWVISGHTGDNTGAAVSYFCGSKATSAALDRVRITNAAADLFDSGSFNALYE